MGYNYDPSQENIDEEDPFGHIPSNINDKDIYGAVDMDNNTELPEGPQNYFQDSTGQFTDHIGAAAAGNAGGYGYINNNDEVIHGSKEDLAGSGNAISQ